jgi:hypothetical protein
MLNFYKGKVVQSGKEIKSNNVDELLIRYIKGTFFSLVKQYNFAQDYLVFNKALQIRTNLIRTNKKIIYLIVQY